MVTTGNNLDSVKTGLFGVDVVGGRSWKDLAGESECEAVILSLPSCLCHLEATSGPSPD